MSKNITKGQQVAMQEAKASASTTHKQMQEQLSDLSPTKRSQIEKRCLEMPKTWRRGYLKAMRGKSMQAAIKAHCGECVGWDRNEVTECVSYACPLYLYRPF